MNATASHEPRGWNAPLLAALLGTALYAHTLAGTLVYDDLTIIKNDPRMQHARLWGQFFKQTYFAGSVDPLWRPITSLSFAVQMKIGLSAPWALHAVNVLLYAGVCALVAELARRLAGERVALVAGLLFAAHPLHVEAVAYLVGRAETICAIGVIGGLVIALRPLSARRIWAIWGCFVLALGAKEQGVLLLIMLAALWPVRRRILGPASTDEGRIAKWFLFLICASLSGYLLYREQMFGWFWERNLYNWPMQPLVKAGPVDRWLIPVAVLGRYVLLLLFPLRLSPEYSHALITPVQRMSDPYLWIGMVAMIGVIALAIVLAMRRRRAALWLLACAAMTYALIGNINMIATIMGDRLAFLPSAFAIVLIAWGAVRFVSHIGGRVVLAIVLALLSVRTVTYAWRWNDRLRLFDNAVREKPMVVQLRILLAEEWQRRGELEWARRVIEEAIAVEPRYWKLWLWRARIAIEQRRFEDAEASLQRAWELDPFLPEVMGYQDMLERRR